VRIVLLCLAVLLNLTTPAAAQEPPRTLAGFRLGMTIDEARAVAPQARWPRSPEDAFRVRGARLELGGGQFNLQLTFVRGVLERMDIDQAYPPVTEPTSCLRALDAIVGDVEPELGPLNAAARENEASGALTETTRTALGSEVRHYHNEQNGGYVGVARSDVGQRAEARALVINVGRGQWGCITLLSVAPLHQPVTTPPPDPASPRLQNVLWLERPRSDDFARVYPQLAMEVSRWGDVNLDCLVEEAGRVDCTIAAESPEGWGFGAAALALSSSFRIAPITRDNIETAGGRVILPIRFRVED
jgi:TonB family protein